DLLRYVGFNGHPNNIAIIFSVFAISLYTKIEKSKYKDVKFIIFCGVFAGLLYITGSRASLIVLPILFAYHLLKKETSILLKIITPTFAFFAIIYILNSELFQLSVNNVASLSSTSASSDADKYVRALMIFNAIRLAT